MTTDNKTKEAKIGEWLLSRDTGLSSIFMASVALGADASEIINPNYPHDAGDFGRCYRLVEQVPEIAQDFQRIADSSKEWGVIISRWPDLASQYEEDLKNGTYHFYGFLDAVLRGEQ